METTNRPQIDILIICEDIDYDRSSGGLVNTKIIAWLSKHYRVCLASMSSEPNGFSQIYRQPHVRVQKSGGFFWGLLGKIPWVRGLPEQLTGINHHMLSRYFGWRKYLHREIEQLSPKVILALSAGMGWYTHQALLTVPKRKEKRVFAFHDPFPMALLPGAKKNELHIKSQQILLRRMNEVVTQADAIWLPSKRLLEWLNPFYPDLQLKANVLPHLAIIPAEFQQDTNEVQYGKEVIKQGKFNLLHMGSLLEGRSPEGFINAALAWLEEDVQRQKDTNISFVGKIWKGYEQLFSALKNHACFHIETGKRVPYHKALQWQKAASVNLVIEMESFGSPQLLGKMADVVWAQQPIFILGALRSEARRLVGESYPYQAENMEVMKIKEILNDLYENWKQGKIRTTLLAPIILEMNGESMLAAVNRLLVAE